jgi:hypothetical protein
MIASEHPHTIAPLYWRDLPGGGYVMIQVDDGATNAGVVRTRVWVERRGAAERRAGHTPLVIAEIDGDERSPQFGDVYRIATDNAAIARALLQVEGPAY